MPPLPPADIAKIQAQRVALVQAAESGDDLTQVIVDSDGGQYDWSLSVTSTADGGSPIVTGRLIVRTKDMPQVNGIVSGGGFGETPSACLARLGLTQLDSSNPSDAMVNYTRAIRNSGLDASLDPILPLNKWTMKGDGGAEPTLRSIGRRPRSTAGRGVQVAVIDSGIQRLTSDEAGNVGRTDGWLAGIPQNAANRDPLTQINERLGRLWGPGRAYLDNAAGHGTFVAGIVRRVAPAARVRVYRAFNSEGIANDITVACAILKAADEGADVINLSLGAETLDGRPPLASTLAIQSLPARIAVVAAAGNTGLASAVYPAALPRVIAVAALGTTGKRRAPFSTIGSWVDVSTIGEGVVSTYVNGVEDPRQDRNLPDSYSGRNPIAMWSGTSFAAPQIAGLIARRTKAAGSPTRAYQQIRRQYRKRGLPGIGLRIPILQR